MAREYRVTAAEVASANQMSEDDGIGGVEALLVPVPPAPALSTHMMLYTARRGDTLVTIADRFGVSLTQLRRWNKMTGIRVEHGRRLRVAEPAIAARTTAKHRRGASVASSKAHAAPAGKNDDENLPRPALIKTVPAMQKKKHTQGPKAAAGARKSGTRGKRISHDKRPAAHSKAPASKQK